jgi:hypothetical protein
MCDVCTRVYVHVSACLCTCTTCVRVHVCTCVHACVRAQKPPVMQTGQNAKNRRDCEGSVERSCNFSNCEGIYSFLIACHCFLGSH